MKELIETGVLTGIGAIVLLAFVVMLRRLSQSNEPIDSTVVDRVLATPQYGSRWFRDVGRSRDEVVVAPPSWRTQERLWKKHREQERARKRRQRNRKGGR